MRRLTKKTIMKSNAALYVATSTCPLKYTVGVAYKVSNIKAMTNPSTNQSKINIPASTAISVPHHGRDTTAIHKTISAMILFIQKLTSGFNTNETN